MGDPDARTRLADLMDQRRRDLRLTWDQVASRAGIHRETLRQIRIGKGAIRPLSTAGLEDALEWARGCIDATLDGGDPTQRHVDPRPTHHDPRSLMNELVDFIRARLAEDRAWADSPECTEDPARVLREVEAKRRIIELHKPEDGQCSTCSFDDREENAGADFDSEPEMIWVRKAVAWPCPTLRLLASVYADHDDYRKEWTV